MSFWIGFVSSTFKYISEYIQGTRKAEPGWQATPRGDSRSCLEKRSPRQRRGATAEASKCSQDCRCWSELLKTIASPGGEPELAGTGGGVWQLRCWKVEPCPRRDLRAVGSLGASLGNREGQAGGGQQRLPACATEPRQQLRTKSRLVLLGGCLDGGRSVWNPSRVSLSQGKTLKTHLVPIFR